MSEYQTNIKSPWSDFIFLLLLTLVSMVIIQAISLGFTLLNSNSNYNTYVLFVASTLGTFIIPALLYQRFRKYKDVFPLENLSNWRFYLFGVLLLFAIGPTMNMIGNLNQKMVLPDFLSGLEAWMKNQEDLMATITAQSVMVDRVDLLFLNIVVIAILPAIGEELFFRGILQHIFTRAFQNPILAIWVVAFIFSAIHLQFYGFLPRFILGVIFGYMLFWTNNIWVPIFAHFVNNAFVTIYAFYYARMGKTYEELVTINTYPIIVYIGSLIFSSVIVLLFYRYSKNKKVYGEKLG